jgi:hypothetical protein
LERGWTGEEKAYKLRCSPGLKSFMRGQRIHEL